MVVNIVEQMNQFCRKNDNNTQPDDRTTFRHYDEPNKRVRNTLVFISDLMIPNYEALKEVFTHEKCAVIIVGILTEHTRPISSILAWLPYNRFIFQFTGRWSLTFQMNNLLQAHKELFKLISNPEYNRFEEKHLGHISDYKFNSNLVEAKDNFRVFIRIWGFESAEFWDMDSILKFASLLKTKGLKVVFVLPLTFAKESTRRFLQEFSIEYIEFLVHLQQMHVLNEDKNVFFVTFSGDEDRIGSQNEIVISFTEDCKAAINVSKNKIEVCQQDFLWHKTLEIIFDKIKRSQT